MKRIIYQGRELEKAALRKEDYRLSPDFLDFKGGQQKMKDLLEISDQDSPVPASTGTGNEELKENESKFNFDEVFGRLDSKLEHLKEQLGTLEAEFKSKIKYDGHKEKIIDDLHREVQEYKNDLIKNLMRPVMMDIIHTIDDITKLVDNHKAKEPTQLDPLKLIHQMKGISSDLEDILYRRGVEPFNCQQPEFDPKRQKIVETETADDRLKDKTISKRVNDGYQWEGKVLRQERVKVYVYKPGPEDPETNKNQEKNHE